MSLVLGALTVVTALLALASLGYLLLSHFAALRHYGGATPGVLPDPAPGVSMLKAVEGADERTYEGIKAFLHVDYPGPWELLVGTVREDDPVADVVRRLQAEYPDKPLRLVFGEIFGTNRKTCLMHKLVQEAQYDLLVFSDGDTQATPDYLHHVVPPLLDDEVGCLTCLPRGIGCTTLGSKVIALHYVHVYVPQWMAAIQTTGVNWAFGNTMASRREVHLAYGGFAAFPDHLADDYEFGHRAALLGKQVVVAPYLIDTYMPMEPLRSTLVRLRRWMFTIRRARPESFAGLMFCYPVAWTLVMTLLNAGQAWAWGVLAAVLAIRLGLACWLDRAALRLPNWWSIWWLLPLVDLIELGTFISAWFGNTVVWAGRRFHLLADGRLVEVE